MRRFLLLFLIPVFTLSALSQENSTFKSQTNLVLVPVEVRNHGQHVPNLDRDKFTMLQDGKPQKVAVFDEVRTTTEHLKRAAVGPGEFSNEFQGSPATARYTIVAIDRINTTTFDMQRLRQGLLKFLDQVADSGEPIRLIAINPTNIEVVQDFTTNPRAIAMALEGTKTAAGKVSDNSHALNESLDYLDAVISQNTTGDNAGAMVGVFLAQLDNIKAMEQQSIAFQQRSSRINSLEALQMVAKTLTGLPGRKSLVWASSGYPFGISVREGRTTTTLDYSQVIEAGNLDEYTMHLLNAANIAVYPVDARGTVNTAWEVMNPSHKYSASYSEKQAAQLNNQQVISTFEHLAASTGGKACFDATDLSKCFKDAMDDARDYYMVGYYADSNTKPGWHKLQVKVATDASVRSRTGFIYSKIDPAETRSQDMRLELNSYLLDPGIPFRGQWTIKEPKGDKKDVGFEMKILPEAKVVSEQEPHLNLEIAAVARGKDGNVAGQFMQKIDRQLPPQAISTIGTSGIQYRNSMALPPGDYLVRLVVRDSNTGRMGSATTMVKVN
jgi:VWFA-related protein